MKGSASQGRRATGSVLYWAPVVLSLFVLAQVSLRGLRPALAESRRLEAAEERMAERCEGELRRNRELERRLRAHADPIFLERERRLLLAPESPLRQP